MPRLCVKVISIMVVVFVMCCSSSCALSYGGNKPCRTQILDNGNVITRARGRFVRYRCNPGYKILGDRTATCLRGRWEYQEQMPVCTRSGCISTPLPRNGQTQQVPDFRGAVVTFSCDPGYSMTGSPAAFCNGFRWNTTAPNCTPEKTATTTECDFEEADLCGWSHAADQHFEWTRHEGPTPSNGVQTGPSWDHTKGRTGAGHYMYTESSSPRQENDTARLVSPVFDASLSSDACLVFYYHMFGLTIGTLTVYVKPEGRTQWPTIFTLSGQQGNQWVRAVARIEPLDENFQIVIEGVRGSTYLGDMAVDDVRLANGSDCESEATTTDAATDAGTDVGTDAATDAGATLDGDASRSCRGRCFETPPPLDYDATVETNGTLALAVCHCNLACSSANTCCDDFKANCLPYKTSPTTASTTASHRTIATALYSPPGVTLLPPPSKPTSSPTTSATTPMSYSTSTSASTPTSSTAPTTLAPASLTSSAPTSSSRPSEEPTTASTNPTLPATPSSEPTLPTTSSTKPPLPTTTTVPTTNSPTTKTTAKTNSPTSLTASSTSPKSSFLPKTSTTASSATTKRTTLSTATTTLATSTTKLRTKTTPTTTKPTKMPSKATSKTTKVSTVSVATRFPSTRKSVPSSSTTSTTSTTLPTVTTSKTSVKNKDKQNSVDVKELIEKETSFLENSLLLKEKPTAKKDNMWQVASQVAESRSFPKLALYSALAAGSCVLLAAVAATSVLLVRRRRSARTRGNDHDESEVRFLTAEEILDFNLAEPKDNDP